jgi:hypothetical protein
MHPNGTWLLLIIAAICVAAMLVLLYLTEAGRILHERIPDRPRRRLLLAATSFLVAFVGVRLVVVLVYFHVPPFGWVTIGGMHVHHLVWGILLLLTSGYGMVAEWGTRATPISLLASRLVSIFYGVGAALTLDEFGMWLNIRDSTWTFQGRESIDAVVVFAALLAAGAWGAPLWTRRPRKTRRRPAGTRVAR